MVSSRHMITGSSLVDQNETFPFELETQRGVAHALASVRASNISSEHKNELRDLIFLYTNGGRDQSVRIMLEQKLAAYHVQPAPMPRSAEEMAPIDPDDPFSGGRVAPSFSVPKSVPVKSAPPAPQSQPVVQSIAEPTPASVVPPSPAGLPPQPPIGGVAQTTPEVAPTVSAPELSFATTPPAPFEPAPISPSAAVAPSQSPVAAAGLNQNQALERIREIKALVNESVGNPVNLVDINNEVGREYMSALLDAMKKINSGTSVTSAMSRLETAYQQVKQTIAEHQMIQAGGPGATAPETSFSVSPEPAVATPITKVQVTAAIPEPQVIPETPPVSIPVRPSESIPFTAEPTPFVPLASAAKPRPNITPPAPSLVPPVSSMPPTGPTFTPPAPKMPPPQQPPSQQSRVPLAELDFSALKQESKQTAASQPPSAPTVATPEPERKFVPLAHSEVKLRTPSELPTAAERAHADSIGDPLFSQEVDDGLEQLLVEWQLFKKSGLFGTGPKGREHPLFLKLAPLQIPLILAGRFDGATQEIRQSVTDYMNGWRYEQGIIYEPGETFEHYLRRIINHILDLQKKKAGP